MANSKNSVLEAHYYHRKAMELAVEASFEISSGNIENGKQLNVEAFRLEKRAAELVDLDVEPTRSILFRSAASLALDCGELREAEKLLAQGLAGDPPAEIAEELRDLFEQVNLGRHLKLRGVELNSGEFQISIFGKSVGHGLIDSSIYHSRIDNTERLIHRTADRRKNLPFRERGKSTAGLDVFLSTPRAASFAITVRVGHLHQLGLPGIDTASAVISDLLDCIDLVEKGGSSSLKSRIPDEAYRRNFLGLVRRIAPDGNLVRAVGFTSSIQGAERHVALERNFSEITHSIEDPDAISKVEIIEGFLRLADATKNGRDRIGIIDSHGEKRVMTVPPGMMDDIVRPLWDYNVQVTVRRIGGRELVLEDIIPLM